MAHYTDLGNAKRLVMQYGVQLLYCTPWRRWLIWDETRWCADETERIMRVAKQVILTLYEEAASVETNGSREALVRHANHSESVAALRNMLTLAASEPGIPVLPEGLNKDPWLLNVHNGTIDVSRNVSNSCLSPFFHRFTRAASFGAVSLIVTLHHEGFSTCW